MIKHILVKLLPGWICMEKNYSKSVIKTDDEIYKILRKIAMENLWWLLHTDNLDEDVTETEAWLEKCNKWNSERCMENMAMLIIYSL